MDSPRKRVAFAPAHESVQRPHRPEAGLPEPYAGGWPQAPAAAPLPGGAAGLEAELEEARRRVQQLEAALQLGAGGSTDALGALGGRPAALLLENGAPPAPPGARAPLPAPPGPAPGPAAPAGVETAQRSTFLLPDMFGGAQFDGREQVRRRRAGARRVRALAAQRSTPLTRLLSCPLCAAACSSTAGWLGVAVGVRGIPQQGRHDYAGAKRWGCWTCALNFRAVPRCRSGSTDAHGGTGNGGRDKGDSPAIPLSASHGEAAFDAGARALPLPWAATDAFGAQTPLWPWAAADACVPQTPYVYHPGGERGSRALSHEECRQFGVPLGTVWKESASKDTSAENGIKRASRQADAAPSPVMYGGYMPTNMASTSPVNHSKNTDVWQA